MLIASGTMVIWLVLVFLLVIGLIIIPIASIKKIPKSKTTLRFKIGDEVIYQDESYVISHIDKKNNYNLINVKTYNFKKIEIDTLESVGILAEDYNKLKLKYGDKNEQHAQN